MDTIIFEKVIRAKKPAPAKSGSYLDDRCGFWGVVTEVHPEDCTVHVKMDTGQILPGVRVASLEWVTIEKGKHLSGERHLPPVGTFVFCLQPTPDPTSAFVLCSGFVRQESEHSAFKKKGSDAANTHEKVENSGWKETTDYRTGTKKFQNRADNPTITIEVDQETKGRETVNLKVHNHTITITPEKIEINGPNTVIKGTQVQLGGVVAPNGTGALCGLPYCLFTGAPQSGNISSGA